TCPPAKRYLHQQSARSGTPCSNTFPPCTRSMASRTACASPASILAGTHRITKMPRLSAPSSTPRKPPSSRSASCTSGSSGGSKAGPPFRERNWPPRPERYCRAAPAPRQKKRPARGRAVSRCVARLRGVPLVVVELFFFGGTGERGHGRGTALDHRGHVVEVARTHFLLVTDEGVPLLARSEFRFLHLL